MQTSLESPLQQVRWLDLPGNPEGPRQLTYAELGIHTPFEVLRVYWIHSLSAGEGRGRHAHRTGQQLLIAANGGFRVRLDDGSASATYDLTDPGRALWIPGGLWREIDVLENGSLLLVLASKRFDESDYIRDYETFLAFARSRHAQESINGR